MLHNDGELSPEWQAVFISIPTYSGMYAPTPQLKKCNCWLLEVKSTQLSLADPVWDTLLWLLGLNAAGCGCQYLISETTESGGLTAAHSIVHEYGEWCQAQAAGGVACSLLLSWTAWLLRSLIASDIVVTKESEAIHQVIRQLSYSAELDSEDTLWALPESLIAHKKSR